MTPDQAQPRMDWLLSDFLRGTPGTMHALVVSVDGLRVARSAGLDDTLGDQLSAAAAGLVSLADGTARLLELGPMHQTIVELAQGHLFLTRISSGATLAVVAERGCDMGLVGYEMTLLASRVGHAVTPDVRTAATSVARQPAFRPQG